MQCKVRCFGHSYPTKHRLKLGTGFEAPHRGLAGMWRISKDQKPVSLGLPDPRELDSQALAALGAARIDHCAATASLHANQKTMGACTADFGGLVSAFHVNFPKRLSGYPHLLHKEKRHECRSIAPNTIRGTRHYRKFSERQQHLRKHMVCSTVRSGRAERNVDKVLINYNPARSNP